MDKNIIKEQEYVRIDEEPKAPKTITYKGENGGEKYVRCDSFEDRINELKESIVSNLRKSSGVVSFNPVIQHKITNGNMITFIARDVEFDLSKAREEDFRDFIDMYFRPRFVRALSRNEGVSGMMKFNKMSNTSSGNEKYDIVADCALRTQPRNKISKTK
ncbi:hypothetical protein [Helicobacter marmotae]|uniref:Uncharacterized protein n=1 Tax=Helicobacter marmotae TaxID=152490 RepID=A0A3D8I5Q4_9HELI|nr:hypothetical protein [Helicobacter marmotae]RDU59891.1 hypothetical protein CQA63_04735 [Helicobacter marmotae]